MEDSVLIRAASAIALEQATNAIKQVAIIHDKEDDNEYANNILLISMIGHCISTGIDKERIVRYFVDILDKRNEEEANILINEAIHYANTTKRKE
tara:strand:+ start:673 stop:957 length:285 start_codon:yes stop_codon:yes gene_type:complete